MQGRIQDFKLGWAHLKKMRRAEGGAKFFRVFRVKNHDFTPKKNHIFSNLGGGGRRIFGPRYIGDDFLLGPRYIGDDFFLGPIVL
jgi:hypothetical protein